MARPFVRLDPSNRGTAAFLRDARALSVWEMLRRLGTATVAEVADACSLPPATVQSAVDAAVALGVAEHVPATARQRRPRFRAVGDQLMVVADHSDPGLRALLSDGFAHAVAESRRSIDASMEESTKAWKGMQTLHQMIDLSLDDAEARELMALCEAVRAFIDRSYEKFDRVPVRRPQRCNYHMAIHLAPIQSDALPSPRIQFVEVATVAGLESDQAKRAGRLLAPRERAVARLLAKGRTMDDAARQLGVSRATVATLCRRAYRKLGITRRAELALRMHDLGEA